MIRQNRAAPLGVFAGLLLCSVSHAAFAQTATTSATPEATAPESVQDDQTTSVGDVVVTGSRIARQDYSAESPIVTVNTEVIKQSGSPTFEQTLNQLPQFTASAGAQTPQANGASRGLGRSTANLRGLGAQRTLVLIDGRRGQPSDANNVIDLNTIPTPLVSGVEVISGGASATYGSDAVAGVINFKLNTRFDGLQLDVDTGLTDKNDGFNANVGLTGGTDFADGRGHVIGSVSYYRREAISRRDREFFDGTLGSSTGPVGIYRPGSNAPSQAAINTLFNTRYGVTGAVSRTADFSVNGDATLYTQVGGINFRPFGPYFYNPIQNEVQADSDPVLQIPLERYTGFGRAEYEVSEAFKPYIQASYSQYTATQHLPGTVATLGTTTMPVTNPYIPNDLRFLLASRAQPNAPFTLRGRLNKLGDQIFTQDYTVYQAVAGATGVIGFKDWSYDFNVTQGLTRAKIAANNYVDATNYQAILNAPDGGSSLCAGGYNPFDLNQPLSDACKSFLALSAASRETYRQTTAELSLQGTLLELPAGPLKFAAGVGYRKNSYSINPDLVLQNGQAIGGQAGANAQLPAGGKLDVSEVFGELLVPVLSDLPLIQDLSLDLAYRYSDYQYGGGIGTYKVGIEWKVADALSFRGGVQRAVRGASLGDLFAAGSTVAGVIGQPTAGGGDPCDVRFSGRNASNVAQIRALCQAQGVPASSLDSFNASGGIRIAQGGNPDLEPEESDSFTIGAVVKTPFLPGALSGITMSLDYYDIEIANALGVTPATTTIISCFNVNGLNPGYSPDSPFCRSISRDGNGFIDVVQQRAQNLLTFETSGLDFQLDWRADAQDFGLNSDWGSLSANVVVSWVEQYNIQPSAVEPVRNFTGTIGNGTIDPEGIAHPEWKGIASLTWERGPLQLGVRYRYIDGMTNVSPANVLYPTVPAVQYWDFNAGYEIRDGLDLRAGMLNAFDEQPVIYQALGTTDSATYDLVGRRFYLGLTARF